MLNLGKEVKERARRMLLVLTVALVRAAMMAVSQAAGAADTPVGPTSNDQNCGGTSSFDTIESLGAEASARSQVALPHRWSIYHLG
jgi:hypothetical protein